MADLDVEMEVDDYQEVMPIPAAYTEDIITGEEQVRLAMMTTSFA